MGLRVEISARPWARTISSNCAPPTFRVCEVAGRAGEYSKWEIRDFGGGFWGDPLLARVSNSSSHLGGPAFYSNFFTGDCCRSPGGRCRVWTKLVHWKGVARHLCACPPCDTHLCTLSGPRWLKVSVCLHSSFFFSCCWIPVLFQGTNTSAWELSSFIITI